MAPTLACSCTDLYVSYAALLLWRKAMLAVCVHGRAAEARTARPRRDKHMMFDARKLSIRGSSLKPLKCLKPPMCANALSYRSAPPLDPPL